MPIAARRTITTRHGLRLAAAPASASAAPVDRLIMPGARRTGEIDPQLAEWAAERGLGVELPQANGEFAFDAMLRDLAAHADQQTARATAKSIEYPAAHLQLAGAAGHGGPPRCSPSPSQPPSASGSSPQPPATRNRP